MVLARTLFLPRAVFHALAYGTGRHDAAEPEFFIPAPAVADSVAISVAAMKKIHVMCSTAQNDAHDYARRVLR